MHGTHLRKAVVRWPGQEDKPQGGDSATAQPRAANSNWRTRLLREPLTHFVLLGVLIFAAAHYLETRSQRYVIAMSPAQQQRIAASYAQQYGAPPSPAEMKAMSDDNIRQEVLLREGLALGLDKDDEIVRRRIAQKFEFLLEDRTTAREPTETDLKTWFAAHRAHYTIPPRRTFDHLYFAIDERGEGAARDLAGKALTALRAGHQAPAADEFPGPPVVRLLSQADTDRLFGGEAFATSIFGAPKGTWSGPYRSAFGWHVVRVTEDQPSQTKDYASARNQVLSDWKQADRTARTQTAYEEIRARYRIANDEAAR